MTVYYAQSAANINASNVWNTAANGSGSYLTWPPASGDVLMSNNKAITVNVDANLGATGQVRNDNANGATAGGSFALTDGVTLTANVQAGATDCVTFGVTSPAAAYVVGSSTGGTQGNADGVVNNSSGTLTLTGNVTGGTSGLAFGAHNASTGTFKVNGTATGGTNSSAYGANNGSTGRLEVSGACYASATTPAVGGLATGVTLLSGPFIGNASGVSALYCGAWRWLATAGSTYITVQTSDLSVARNLYTADSVGGNPAASNVRHGTTYGPANELTGTAYIPAAASVLYGVPVDNTTGTATIAAADIRAAIGLSSANLDTQLNAKPSAQNIWEYSTRALTDKSGFSATATNFSAAPTASDNATAVWGAESRTLTSSSGLTAQQVWEYATRTLTSGSGVTAQDVWEYATRALTEAPDVPTVEEIAAEVRTELTPELSRVANCATVESTGDQLAGLL